MTKIARIFALALGLASLAVPAMAQTLCGPTPALPDTERRTEYAGVLSQTGPFNVGFQLYGDGTDYGNWVSVWVNGVALTPVTDFTVTSPSGALANLCRPISDAQVTFTAAQTGTIEIEGSRRPRRASQFSENAGVTARSLNQVLSDMEAQLRERWDRQSRLLRSPPGETVGVMPLAATRAGKFLGFDNTGLNPVFLSGGAGSGNVVGPVSSVVGNVASWNNATGTLLADAGVASASIIKTIEDYGAATTNSGTANLTAIQAAFDATPNGGTIAIKKAGYAIAGQLVITKNIKVACAGPDPTVGANLTQLTTSSNTLAIRSGYVTVDGCSFGMVGSPTGTATGIVIGDDALRKSGAFTNGSATLTCSTCTFTSADVGKGIWAGGAGVAGAPLFTSISAFIDATHVTMSTPAGTTNASLTFAYGFNYQEDILQNVKVYNHAIGINIVAATQYHILRPYVLGADPLIIQNQLWGDQGDGEVSGGTFIASVAGSHNTVLYTSGGGLRFIGNKVLSQAATSNCIEITWNLNTSVGPFMSGNSIEGSCVQGISIDGSVALHTGTITGNEIAVNGTGIVAAPSAAHPSWTITGNVIRAAANNTGISLANMTAVNVVGNNVQNADGSASGTAYVLGGTATGYLHAGFTSQTNTLTNASASMLIDNPQGMTFANLPGVAANGSKIFVTDAKAGSNPCVAGGTGAQAIRQNGAWSCGNSTETTWTPTLNGSTGGTPPTLSVAVGSYEKIGRTYLLRFTIVVSAAGAPTGNMRIGGLPAAATATTNDNGGCTITYMGGVTLSASYATLTGIIVPSATNIDLFELGSGQSGQAAAVAKFGATVLEGMCNYHT